MKCLRGGHYKLEVANLVIPRFSLKNQSKDTTRSKEIEELNKTIKQLRSQIGEQEIALRTVNLVVFLLVV